MRIAPLLSTSGLLLAGSVCTLAQTVDPNFDNADSPFIRNLRPDRPGQTVTTNILRPGRVQVEVGSQRQLQPATGKASTFSRGLLRVGVWGLTELRVEQGYQHSLPAPKSGAADPATGGPPVSPDGPSGFVPLTVGFKLLASSNQDGRSQVALLAEMTLRNGDASYLNKVYEPAARVLISQQLGQRFGLEVNLGFRQRGFRGADTSAGQYLGTLALNGPLGKNFGFLTETYATWQPAAGWRPGLTAGLSWRPATNLRLDVTAGNGPGTASYAPSGPYLGVGFSARIPH